jgi:hypothetical protein
MYIPACLPLNIFVRLSMAREMLNLADAPTLTIADAILDRLVPRSHRIDLKGKSLRKRPKHLS